ncbi:hypothetical protein BN7_2037 [Wickerhamomyces ciferrii]|uniref:Regulator of rDNA transcription 14 n=1 Tax=Wickerhamomyces ciferrii (strain ATCC 14091 / BCRC 22168 / CBS 111 / JCM 3599 / NBRC 0793 / NRRL Y-1031 F-60-10) TaxID=1206466 RepID=K0KJZ7_WICCF|nr:uncharacterized protein BN7_2037 [Wickerhamomyces ciferrii]CCH42492.1 hypothetical protein BN7_2037 [Wickerhamomyces ciferrii]
MSITFNNPSKSTKTVNKLLAKVLPGQSSSNIIKSSSSSTSQQLTSHQQNHKIDPYKVQKQDKKQKRQAIKIINEKRAKLLNEAKAKILEDHLNQGTLSKEEKLELKLKIKKNVTNLQSWSLEQEDDLKEIQDQILSMKNKSKKKIINKKSKSNQNDIYDKKTIQRYPGLTPGLAPVDMDDSEEESD